MSALEKAQAAVAAAQERPLVGVFGAGEYREALLALLTVAEEQDVRLDRLEERIGETIGMGG
jgi:hypothetical protein